MDHSLAANRGAFPPNIPRPENEFLLPTRQEALNALHSSLTSQAGPALLTGDSGTGKSWLCRRLRADTPQIWHWASIDLSAAVSPNEFYALILHALGVPADAQLASLRATLADTLHEASVDGLRWGLIVDEAQTAQSSVLEEIRILGNRMGEPGTFSAQLIVGQNPLLNRLSTRPLAPLHARLAKWIHLQPLSLDELAAWLAQTDPARTWRECELEILHRDTGGIPRKILFQVGAPPRNYLRLDNPPLRQPQAPPATVPEPIADDNESEAAWEESPLIPVKPPLQLSESVIEVGWDDNLEEETEIDTLPDVPTNPSSRQPIAEPRSIAPAHSAAESLEAVEDHYATLQASSERARNASQPRREQSVELDRWDNLAETDSSDETEAMESEDGEEGSDQPLDQLPDVWAEGQHTFAPYSQLFSRLRPTRDSC